MSPRYQDVYPSAPLLASATRARPAAAELLSLEYFEAEPGEMPQEVFPQHHVLLNLRDEPHLVENWRDGVHREFQYGPGEVIVTPAGIRSGWRWHSPSKVLVVTLEPERLRRFAENEAGLLLTETQLQDREQFYDPDLCDAGVLLRDALAAEDPGSAVVYESLARIFLVQLLRGYAEPLEEEPESAARISSKRFRRVLRLIEERYSTDLAVEDLAREARLSPSHFSRVFKRSLGQTPHRFLMQYRIEKACEVLSREPERPLSQIALDLGFADQAHFSRTFKRFAGTTPRGYRAERA